MLIFIISFLVVGLKVEELDLIVNLPYPVEDWQAKPRRYHESILPDIFQA